MRRCLGVREHDAVVADLDLDDLRDAVLGAVRDFARGDAARGVRDVGMLDADAAAERLDAAAAARRLDLRRLEARAAAAELLGDDRGERIHRG